MIKTTEDAFPSKSRLEINSSFFLGTLKRPHVLMSVLLGLISLAYYILVPTQLISTKLTQIGFREPSFFPEGIKILVFSLWFSIFYFLFSSKNNITQRASPFHFKTSPYPSWANYFLLTAAFSILLGSLLQIQSPLTYDEMNIGGALANRSFSQVIDLILQGLYRATNTQHTLSSLTAYFSMVTFGKSAWIMRLSAIPFAILFLLTVYKFCKNFLPLMATLIVFGNLLANENVTFYLHSPRGFVTMMLFSLLSLMGVLKLIKPDTKLTPFRYSCFGLFYFSLILTNTNGGMFALFLFCSLVFWALLNKKQYSREQFQSIKCVLLIMVLLLPLFFIGALREAQVQSGLSQLNGYNKEWNLGTMGYLFGFDRIWWSKLVLIFSLGLFVFRIRKFKLTTDFLSLFLLLSWLALFTILLVLGVRSYEARYALAFLVPFLAWLGQTIDLLPRYFRAGGIFLVGILTILLPLLSRHRVYESITGSYEMAHTFLVEARNIAREPKSCFSFKGDNYEITAAKELYFQGVQLLDNTSDLKACPLIYQLRMKEGSKKILPKLPGQTIYFDSEGRSLAVEQLHN